MTENAPGVCSTGGTCACPNGETYDVGRLGTDGNCSDTLACLAGGIQTGFYTGTGKWSNRSVACYAPAPVVVEEKAAPTCDATCQKANDARIANNTATQERNASIAETNAAKNERNAGFAKNANSNKSDKQARNASLINNQMSGLLL